MTAPARLPPELIAITPGAGAADLEARVRAALAGGVAGVLVREPGLEDAELLALARRLRDLLDGAWLGVHDRAHLAAACGADAVHVGFRSLRPSELRGWLDPRIAVGLSTHAGDDPATWAGADYLFHGPLNAVAKDVPSDPVGPQGLAAAVERSPAPVWALGGIGPGDVAACRAAGARGVAVLSGVLGADDPESAARAYRAAWAAAATPSG